jgi:hypothetical protein
VKRKNHVFWVGGKGGYYDTPLGGRWSLVTKSDFDDSAGEKQLFFFFANLRFVQTYQDISRNLLTSLYDFANIKPSKTREVLMCQGRRLE